MSPDFWVSYALFAKFMYHHREPAKRRLRRRAQAPTQGRPRPLRAGFFDCQQWLHFLLVSPPGYTKRVRYALSKPFRFFRLVLTRNWQIKRPRLLSRVHRANCSTVPDGRWGVCLNICIEVMHEEKTTRMQGKQNQSRVATQERANTRARDPFQPPGQDNI